METRYCKTCEVNHPLTKEFWYRLEASPRCKKTVLTKVKARQTENPDYLTYQKSYRDKNPEKRKEENAAWRQENLEQHRANARKYYQENKPHVHARIAKRKKEHLPTRLAWRLRGRLRQALNLWKLKKVGSHIANLGCTMEELVTHLESKFRPGMSWETYGLRGWHIDHIKPLASFDLENPVELAKATHYTNLQPLWAKENHQKGDKLEWHFQM